MRPAQIARLTTVLALAFGAALKAPGIASAQELTPGKRVRVSAPDFGIDERKGTLVRMTPDSVTIDLAGKRPTVTLPVHGIDYLDVWTGKRTFVGFARGAFAGVLAGSLTGAWLSQRGDCGHMCGLAGYYGFIVGAGVGLLFGSAIGVATAPDRWEEVSLHRETRELGMLGAGQSMRVGFTISF